MLAAVRICNIGDCGLGSESGRLEARVSSYTSLFPCVGHVDIEVAFGDSLG